MPPAISKRRQRRLQVRQLLRARDMEGLQNLAEQDPNLISGLVAQLNERDSLLCWRAVEALGLLCAGLARRDLPAARNQIRRQFWTMTEESGNQAWHTPEAIAEMLYHVPQLAQELGPNLAQHQEEPIFRPGVLWAIGRLASRYPELMQEDVRVVPPHLGDPVPLVRAHAAWALGQLRYDQARKPLRLALGDTAAAELYSFASGELVATTVAELAREALERLA